MTIEPIRPELVAGKIAAATNLEEPKLAEQLDRDPRLVELMWFIQWKSFQPGGLGKMVEDLVSKFADRVVSDEIKAAGTPDRSGEWTLEQALRAWAVADSERNYWLTGEEPGEAPREDCSFGDWKVYYFNRRLTADQIRCGNGCNKDKLLAGLQRFNYRYFKERAEAKVKQALPEYLRDLCTLHHTHFRAGPSWFPDVIPTLLEFMASHASEAQTRLAMTEVAEKVFDALDYSCGARKLVFISGSSRFGKTESVKTWCRMHPGRARLVTVPWSNADSDLFRAIAEALGMPVSFGAHGNELRTKIEYILRNGQLGLIFDECHFLFPIRYNRNSAPSRLNWLRTQVVDRGLPCALVSTPQAYEGQSARFLKATGYNMEQWTGRISLNVGLRENLSKEDLMAVAKLHFGDFTEPLLRLVRGVAMHSESYLKAVEDIATRARWIADRRGGSAVALADVEAAIRDVVPSAAQVLCPGAAAGERDLAPEPGGKASRERRKTSAEVVQELRPGAKRQTDFSVEQSAERSAESLPAPGVVTV